MKAKATNDFVTNVIIPRAKAREEANKAIPSTRRATLTRQAKALVEARGGKGKTATKLARAIARKDYARIEKTLANVAQHAG